MNWYDWEKYIVSLPNLVKPFGLRNGRVLNSQGGRKGGRGAVEGSHDGGKSPTRWPDLWSTISGMISFLSQKQKPNPVGNKNGNERRKWDQLAWILGNFFTVSHFSTPSYKSETPHLFGYIIYLSLSKEATTCPNGSKFPTAFLAGIQLF